MNEEQLLATLKDIRPPVEVPDPSWYLFLGLIAVVLLLLSGIGILLYRLYSRRRAKTDIRAICLQQLQQIDWNDSKSSAYAITKYGRPLAVDERSKRLYDELVAELESHKYRPEVPEISESVRSKFTLFLGVLRA